jgi:hypothetical protein
METPLATKQPRARYGHRKTRSPNDAERHFLAAIGTVIKTKRIMLHITGEALSRLIGVTVGTQFHRESGDVSMPMEEIYRYANALGCKPSDLVKEAEELAKAVQ